MSTVVKDLGAVSAYAYAVEKGYTGTEAEFAELMADYAEVGQRAEDAADSALESKTAAQTAATTATNKASEATTAATTATTKAGEASTSASTATSAKDTAVSASQTATTKATEATTAAATATSAKTDAVAANTAAQSAKTAAQTAQTGAETAAASVSASAEQIATNAADISQLKSELTDIRVGADGTTYETAGAAVRGQINKIKTDLNASFETEIISNTENINITPSFTSGYMGENGGIGSADSLQYTQKISVQEGDVVTGKDSTLVHAVSFRFVTAFHGNTAITASGAQNKSLYTVPSGIDGVVLSIYVNQNCDGIFITRTTEQTKYKDTEVLDLRTGADGTVYDSAGAAVRSQIANLTNVFDKKEFIDNLMIVPSFTNGHVDPTTGNPSSAYATTYEYTQPINVQEGDVVTGKDSTLVHAVSFRWIAAFKNGVVVPSAGMENKSSYTVPSGVDSIILTCYQNHNCDEIHIDRNSSKLFVKDVLPKPMGFMQIKGNLSDGDSLNLPVHNVKNQNVVSFTANIVTFDKITIGKNASGTPYITIDNTNVFIQNDMHTFTVAHGLTIENNIQVLIETESSIYVKRIVISSSGEDYIYTNSSCRWIADIGAYYVISDGSELTDCVFSWTSRNINKPIWLFGDSYISFYEQRWTYYLVEDGYDKSVMLNGYAGENSANAMIALKNLLAVRVPDIVVWCLGMNDTDSSSAVNASWYTNYLLLIELSKKYGFTLILATIPSIPTATNAYKNDIVRSSGYRYIDFAKAVNTDDNGAWITGALSNDGAHPTVKGAKILYHRVLSDFPEIVSD